MARPPSSSPIYESIPEQLALQASGGDKGKQDKRNRASLVYDKLDQPSKPLSRVRQPQLPAPGPPVQKRVVSKKSVSPEKTGRLAPIGGVTKLNPLLDEQNQLGGSAVEQGGTEDLGAELPTQAVSLGRGGHVKCLLGGAVRSVERASCMHNAQCAMLSYLSHSLSQLEDLKLTGGAADGWMLY